MSANKLENGSANAHATSGLVEIKNPEITRGRRLIFTLNVRGPARDALLSDALWVEYDVRIAEIPLSLLTIPCVSSLATLAWATGCKVSVQQIDEAFARSLFHVRDAFKRFYPKLPFSGTLRGQRVTNDYAADAAALLFSAGVDSIASYLRYRHLRPSLLTFFGGDISLTEEALRSLARRRIARFAAEEKIGFWAVTSNARFLLDETYLNRNLRALLGGNDWWGGFSHGIVQLGVCAPICALDGVGRLVIASTHT
mgnify:CR=1 FL=1